MWRARSLAIDLSSSVSGSHRPVEWGVASKCSLDYTALISPVFDTAKELLSAEPQCGEPHGSFTGSIAGWTPAIDHVYLVFGELRCGFLRDPRQIDSSRNVALDEGFWAACIDHHDVMISFVEIAHQIRYVGFECELSGKMPEKRGVEKTVVAGIMLSSRRSNLSVIISRQAESCEWHERQLS
jgi:hypothetical protein